MGAATLTGIRFELQRWHARSRASPRKPALGACWRPNALATEQRELRHFIDGLKPKPTLASGTRLTARLQALRERVSLEWKVPITIRVGADTSRLSAQLEDALPFMAHEAIVNALKHAHPSRVSVDVDAAGGLLRLVVIDDGCGFPFRGTYPHARLRDAQHCPVSLFDRTSALGGHMNIESSDTGSRVEIAFPLAVDVA
jgi:two-component system sensor histidine kinase NreB